MAVFCSQCGASMSSNTRFCEKCGAQFGERGISDSPRPSQQDNKASPSRVEFTSSSSRAVRIGGAIVLVVLMGVAAASYFSRSPTTTSNQATTTQSQPTTTQNSSTGVSQPAASPATVAQEPVNKDAPQSPTPESPATTAARMARRDTYEDPLIQMSRMRAEALGQGPVEEQFEEGLSEKSYAALEEEVQLDLLYMKLNPTLLDEKEHLNYLIYLDDCRSKDRAAIKSFNNEFEYPKYAAQYRARAKEILQIVPNNVTRILSGVGLGTYNMEKKVFPFNEPVTFDSFYISNNAGSRYVRCQRETFSPGGTAFRSAHAVSFAKVKFSELPMEESAARDFVAQHSGNNRAVMFKLDIDILPQVTRKKTNYGSENIEFSGQLKRVTALDLNSVPISVLFESK